MASVGWRRARTHGQPVLAAATALATSLLLAGDLLVGERLQERLLLQLLKLLLLQLLLLRAPGLVECRRRRHVFLETS